MTNVSKFNFESRYQKLNSEQRQAVDTMEGCVMVVAGPGSGKTELLAMRTANILKNLQVNPGNVLLLTFTENAAYNMRDRLYKLIGDTAYGVAIYTFHGFANDIISRYGEYFFNGSNFRPITDVEKINIIEKILKQSEKKSKLGKREFEGGYIFTSDILACISGLKKGNISPSDLIQKINDYYSVWQKINNETSILEKVSGAKKFDIVFTGYVEFYASVKKIVSKMSNDNQREYLNYFLNTLDLEIIKSKELSEHKNLLEWRDDFFTKDEECKYFKILKDSRKEKIEKWLELAHIYTEYISETNKSGLYDFDDMIYLVAKELASNSSLRSELEEKFQFIMVDEFQDTNESQFSLIQNLTKSPVHEGNPNLLVVGDDDQAIYKFQGAELSNIYKFLHNYPKTEKIVLDKNYRSTQNILNFARESILKGFDRLETRDKTFTKKLTAAGTISFGNREVGQKVVKFENQDLEHDFITSEIKKLLQNGVQPQEISVISNKHDTLKQISAYFNLKKIPFSYEKKEHVLDKQHIHELLLIVEYLNSTTTQAPKDYLLPEILSFKFWNLDRLDIWRIALSVQEREEIEDINSGQITYLKRNWLSGILKSSEPKIKTIGTFLLELANDAKTIPLEHLLDKIIGTTEWEFEGEYADLEETKNNLYREASSFISPYKNYYFGKDNFLHNKPEYLDFLFSLRTFIGALREFKQGQVLKASDIDEFLYVYRNNDKLNLTTVSPFASSANSVILQTAYKSKGLEYEYVFVVNANEKDWNSRGNTNKIGFPKNLKLLNESDEYDDKLRLFYVALTRAKHSLYITYTKEKLNFISDTIETIDYKSEINSYILKNLELTKKQDYIIDEEILLKRLLENYQMPVTHLTNFLHLGKVGPGKFVEQNLLRFPQAMSEAAIYGSAMHFAIQCYFNYFKKHQKLPSLDTVNGFLENALIKYKMPEDLFRRNFEEGKRNLKIYFEDLKKRGGINFTDVIEFNFRNEGVKFGNNNTSTHATGKIDKISINQENKNEIFVTDFKTGKSFKSWEAKDSEYTKIKLHFYQYQLAFYKLLIKNSRTYKDYKVNIGKIEFIEADDNEKINVLELELDDQLVNRVENLANIVYQKILNLDFPDTTKYTHTQTGQEKSEIKLSDIIAFEDDLLQLHI